LHESETSHLQTYGRKTTTRVTGAVPPAPSPERIIDISKRSPEPSVVRYGYRSFVRHWLIADPRLIDLPRPPLWAAQSDQQVYLISWLTGVLGHGPAAVVTALIPDLDSFRGSFGGKHVILLWRDTAATIPNITGGLLERLATVYAYPVAPKDFLAYCYAILATPEYTRRFADDLATSPPRVPITKEAALFRRGMELGRQIVWLHTYGERFVPEGERPGRVPPGGARALKPVPGSPDRYPRDFHWEETTETLRVGDGTFGPVSREVWEFEVSGLRPVRAWLGYRMREPSGRHSSPLDNIRPETWPPEFTEDLLQLLWVLERTVALFPDLAALIDDVLQGNVFTGEDLPKPTQEQRTAPAVPRVTSVPEGQMTFGDNDNEE
jgi:hypothetical protein